MNKVLTELQSCRRSTGLVLVAQGPTTIIMAHPMAPAPHLNMATDLEGWNPHLACYANTCWEVSTTFTALEAGNWSGFHCRNASRVAGSTC
eukprot:1493896-Pleurochrysis_carterae.AAC.1